MSTQLVRHQNESREKDDDPLEDVAVQFFQLMHQRRNPKVRTRGPGRIETDTNGQAATTQASAGATGENGAPERAKLIAEQLIKMGDDLEKKLQLDALREAFEQQFKLQSVFQMAYDGFNKTCVSFLARTRGQMRTGWDQLYVLMYGQSVVSEELYREAQGVPEAAENRVNTMARYLRDTVREIGLDEWIEAQGGMDNLGNDVVGDERLVEVKPPEESSVDK